LLQHLKVAAAKAAKVVMSVAKVDQPKPKTTKDLPKPNYAFIAPVETPNSTSIVPFAGYVSAEVTAGIVGGFQQPSEFGFFTRKSVEPRRCHDKRNAMYKFDGKLCHDFVP
jgi:hypothetical protein